MTNKPMVKPMDYAALGIKVESLEGDVREVKDSILGLDAKIEKSISSLAHEVRASITAISNQFTESQRAAADRQRTPWGVLISGAMAIVAVLGIVGSQALTPLQTDIKALKEQIVPREEINFRSEVANRRFSAIEADITRIEQREYDRLQGTIRDLTLENHELRKSR